MKSQGRGSVFSPPPLIMLIKHLLSIDYAALRLVIYGKTHKIAKNCQHFNMAKKTFVSKSRLVKGDRWYIDYCRLNAETGIETRHRQDFDLNEIENLEVREAVAVRLVRYLEQFTRQDWKNAPAVLDSSPVVEKQSVEQALLFALSLKLVSPRKNTHRGYKSISGMVLLWAKERSYAKIPIGDFSKKHARAFFDWLTTRRQYRGCTLNNYLTHTRALWSEMISRDICTDNPWKSIKPFRTEEKLRRAFNEDERRVVAAYIRDHDYWLFRALLLQFFCYIRPVELSRIRGKNFDFAKGIVKVESFEAKKWRSRWATIPASVRHFFVDGTFEKCPANYHPFGLLKRGHGDWTLGPSPEKIGDNRMYRRHDRYLQRLKEDGKLVNTDGLTWYSWKDTGISLHARRTTALSTRDQAGHKDFDITLVYYESEQVNAEYKALANDLF